MTSENMFNNIYFIEPGLRLKKYICYGFINERTNEIVFLFIFLFLLTSLKISLISGFFITFFGLIGYIFTLIYLYLRGKDKTVHHELLKQVNLKKYRIAIFRDGPHLLHFRLSRIKYLRFCYEDIGKLNEIEEYIISKLKPKI